MEQFKRNTEVVLSCMKDNGYNPEVIRLYKRMYQSLSSMVHLLAQENAAGSGTEASTGGCILVCV